MNSPRVCYKCSHSWWLFSLLHSNFHEHSPIRRSFLPTPKCFQNNYADLKLTFQGGRICKNALIFDQITFKSSIQILSIDFLLIDQEFSLLNRGSPQYVKVLRNIPRFSVTCKVLGTYFIELWMLVSPSFKRLVWTLESTICLQCNVLMTSHNKVERYVAF